MKGAAVIYLLNGIAILALDVTGSISNGLSIGTPLLALWALSFLLLARSLFKSRARSTAIACSLMISVGFAATAYMVADELLPGVQKFGGWPGFFELVAPLAVLSLAHILALAFLLNDSQPNYSLKRTAAE